MPKNRTDPVKDDDGSENHPAFGMISVHRIHSSPGEVLFQSDLHHSEYVTIEVHEASRQRDLKHDWVHPESRVCEVSMSMAQFASFVSSAGTQGIPCTIEYTGNGKHGGPSGRRPGLKAAPRLSVTSAEVSGAARAAYGRIQDAYKAYEESLGLNGKGATSVKKAALRTLEAAIKNASSNVDYAAQCLDRHAEEVVEKSRADIEAMVMQTAERLGVDPGSVKAIESGAADE